MHAAAFELERWVYCWVQTCPVQRVFKDKPLRLDLIFQCNNAPVYFVTFNTHTRSRLLATPEVHEAFIKYCRRAADCRIGVRRYSLMPDHVHLFVCFGIGCTSTLGAWVKGLKRELDRVLLSTGHRPVARPGQKLCSFWQPGFNDHLLRSDETYTQKWEYVFRIQCAADSLLGLKIGRTPVKLFESIGRDVVASAVASGVVV